jgi:alpha-glucosidase (family GH31 glycosyl hydrolase)
VVPRNARYPIGFSGDTVSTWASLAFQPYFTATAANVAYGWWSHDIGGHMYGERDAELYTRWVQYGVFSPILRLHSTNNPYLERRPWGYDHEVFHVAQQAMQLRHALIPYIYSMAWKNTASSRPLALPMYYLHPEEEDAYHCQAQYYYGSELLAAPFTSPRHPDTNLSKQAVWLPAGEWFDFFSGQYYSGGRWQVVYGGLADIPVFARAGAIVPLGPRLGQEGTGNPSELDLYIFPGASNSFELYEDDGETQAYQAGHSCLTTFAQSWAGNALAFTIQPAAGETALIPARRSYTLHFRGIRQPDKIDIRLDGKSLKASSSYDDGSETLAVSGISLSPANRLVITLKVSSGSLISGRDRRLEACRQALHTFRVEADACFRIDPFLPDILAGSVALLRFANRFKDAHLDVLANIIRRNQ